MRTSRHSKHGLRQLWYENQIKFARKRKQRETILYLNLSIIWQFLARFNLLMTVRSHTEVLCTKHTDCFIFVFSSLSILNICLLSIEPLNEKYSVCFFYPFAIFLSFESIFFAYSICHKLLWLHKYNTENIERKNTLKIYFNGDDMFAICVLPKSYLILIVGANNDNSIFFRFFYWWQAYKFNAPVYQYNIPSVSIFSMTNKRWMIYLVVVVVMVPFATIE